jgi:hypothetical protein
VKPGRDAAGRDWTGFRANEDYVVAGVDQAPLLPTMVVLLLGLGATMLAWHREGALMPFIPGFPRGNRL